MTQQPRQSGSELIGELQRWLVRSGARSVSRELSGQIRTVLGGGQERADVWETATADHDEAPECAWCPICRARRRLRESGPGLASGVAAAADAVNVVMQDAMTAFETAVAAAGRGARPRTGAPAPGEVWDEATDEPAPPTEGVTVTEVTVTEVVVTEVRAEEVPAGEVPVTEFPAAGAPAGETPASAPEHGTEPPASPGIP